MGILHYIVRLYILNYLDESKGKKDEKRTRIVATDYCGKEHNYRKFILIKHLHNAHFMTDCFI